MLIVPQMPYDVLQLAAETERLTVQDKMRKYYRTARPGRWYGGIASADCCGCNLRCVFCWSGKPRDNPSSIGKFYTPEHIFKKLTACADKFGYTQLRVSGNEPTIGKEHLFGLLALIDQTNYSFILETNGTLIGADKEYARQLTKFRNIHVRLSLKGTNPTQFNALTDANPEGFKLQLGALENLLDSGVSVHPAVMLSFSSKEDFKNLKQLLAEIDPQLNQEVEEEYVFLYPHVSERLKKAGLTPTTAFNPHNAPKDLI